MHKSSFNQSPALRAATLVAILVSSNLSDQPGRAYATDPIRHAEPDSSTDQPCVLLRNGNVLFGSAVKIGDMICITRDDQSTINLPTSQVESIGKSLHELYEFRRQDRFPDDLKRVQSDIRWCLLNGLIREAAADVLHARSLDPLDPQTVQLLRQVASRMKQQTNPEGTSKSNDTMPTIGDKPMIQTVSHESPAQEPPLETRHADQQPSIGLSEKSIHEFSAKIQPILMNRCVSCHAKDDPNNRVFKIHSSLTSRWAPKIVADENLRAVMQFVDLAAPANSVIRIKASDGHGGRRHSFGGSGSAMMGNLDRWLSQLQTTAGSQTADYIDTPQASWNEVIDEHEPTNDPLFLTQPPELSPLHSESTSAGPVAIPALPEPIESRSQPWATGAATKSDTPHQMRRMPKVKNPFDPEIFNRRFHGP